MFKTLSRIEKAALLLLIAMFSVLFFVQYKRGQDNKILSPDYAGENLAKLAVLGDSYAGLADKFKKNPGSIPLRIYHDTLLSASLQCGQMEISKNGIPYPLQNACKDVEKFIANEPALLASLRK